MKKLILTSERQIIYFLNRKTLFVYLLDNDYSSYQTNYDQTYQDLAAYQGYDQSSLSSSPYVSLNEKQDELDMDVSDIFWIKT